MNGKELSLFLGTPRFFPVHSGPAPVTHAWRYDLRQGRGRDLILSCVRTEATVSLFFLPEEVAT